MLVALCVVAIFAWFYWLTEPAPAVGRWLSFCVLMLLLAAMLLPPELIAEIRLLVVGVFPLGDDLSGHDAAPFWIHFGLFFGYSLLVLWQRCDLATVALLSSLLGLAATTEILQLMVEGRSGNWLDVGINVAGVLAAAVVMRTSILIGYRHGG